MKKPRRTFRRAPPGSAKPKPESGPGGPAASAAAKPIRPAPLRHVAPLPPPLRNDHQVYGFSPELTTGYGDRRGILFPIESPQLVDVLAICPFRAVLSQHDRATITGLWALPDDPPSPLPDFLVHSARAAIKAGDAYLLLGRDEAALREVAVRLCHRLGAVVIDAS